MQRFRCPICGREEAAAAIRVWCYGRSGTTGHSPKEMDPLTKAGKPIRHKSGASPIRGEQV